MVKNGQKRAAGMYPVPSGPHVGGQPLSELTAKQRQAVGELGLSEEEWDTSTWQFREHDFNKLKPAVRRAAAALGFDTQSWFLYAAVVRSKHKDWLARITAAQREPENKIASKPPGEASAPKRGNQGASSSKAATSLRQRSSKGAMQEDAEGGVQGAAVVGGEGVDDPAMVTGPDGIFVLWWRSLTDQINTFWLLLELPNEYNFSCVMIIVTLRNKCFPQSLFI